MELSEIVTQLSFIINEAEDKAYDSALYWVLNNCKITDEDYDKIIKEMNYPCYD